MERKIHLIESGPERFLATLEAHEARGLLRAEVESRHADEVARAGIVGKIVLRWRVHREFRREWRDRTPSASSNWLGSQETGRR